MKAKYLLTSKNQQANKPRPIAISGFGLLETIISAVILAILVATSVTITNKYQFINYRSSLRQALSQTVDDDLTEIKLELESYLYEKKTQSQSACYATNRSCQQSTAGVGQCKYLAQRAIAASPLIKDGEISFNTQTHQVFKGLQNAKSGLKRIVTVKKPEAPTQANQSITLMDESIIRVTYTLEGELAQVLFDSANLKTIGSVDLSPPAHSLCQY
ncbi:hypothetical protein [Synechococcus sp. MU1648]|uniref:type II secretion system protein n=1 Tax=Synechococcus sp. MU1648 TaxID=2508351 RepID=UPI002025E375|nr:hypothetical protein [Synechococcus sp. MU1648]